jgi:hypothetical protein
MRNSQHTMTNRKIKVVKRDAPTPEPEIVSKPEANPNRDMTNTVKDWISERRENSQAESASNARKFARLNKRLKLTRKPA